MTIPGTKHAAAVREDQRNRRELVTEIDLAWKLLDREKPLTGKQKVQMQNLLVKVKHALKAGMLP